MWNRCKKSGKSKYKILKGRFWGIEVNHSSLFISKFDKHLLWKTFYNSTFKGLPWQYICKLFINYWHLCSFGIHNKEATSGSSSLMSIPNEDRTDLWLTIKIHLLTIIPTSTFLWCLVYVLLIYSFIFTKLYPD